MRTFHLPLLLVAVLVAAPVGAQPIPALDPSGPRGDFSGTFFHPEQSGHGVFVEILDNSRAGVAWFTFDPQGNPLWLYGLLEVQGSRLVGDLSTVSGGVFGPGFDATLVESSIWGSVQIEIIGCNSVELGWDAADPAYGNGSLEMVRLTALQGQRCNVEEQFSEQRIFSFERGDLGFEAVFADLPVDGQDIYELDYAREQLPAPLQARRGVRLTGHNRSDDLAMLVKSPLGGLAPDTLYNVELELELASNVPAGCFGIGGSPGDSVYMKLGASTQEPLAVSQNEGGFPTLRLNIDYGSQSEGGEQALMVGTLANSQDCEDGSESPWELKTLDTRGESFRARSDADGRLWVFAGTDSAFEGLTEVYFTALRVRLEPVVEAR